MIHRTVRGLLALHPLKMAGIAVLADLFALFLYALYTQDILESRFFRAARDRGLAEIIQYLKVGLILVMLYDWRRHRAAPILTAWIVLMWVMLLDDSIGLHEEIGGWLMAVLPFPEWDGVRTKDLAEAVAFLLLEGSACLNVVARFPGAERDLRFFSVGLALALAPLVFFGIVADILHWPLLEQTGEMAAMTLLLAYVHCRVPAQAMDP